MSRSTIWYTLKHEQTLGLFSPIRFTIQLYTPNNGWIFKLFIEFLTEVVELLTFGLSKISKLILLKGNPIHPPPTITQVCNLIEKMSGCLALSETFSIKINALNFINYEGKDF